MEKHSENETRKMTGSADPADGALSDQELDAISGGDEAPKETLTFNYNATVVRYTPQTGE